MCAIIACVMTESFALPLFWMSSLSCSTSSFGERPLTRARGVSESRAPLREAPEAPLRRYERRFARGANRVSLPPHTQRSPQIFPSPLQTQCRDDRDAPTRSDRSRKKERKHLPSPHPHHRSLVPRFLPHSAECARWDVGGTARSCCAASASPARSPSESSDRCPGRPAGKPARRARVGCNPCRRGEHGLCPRILRLPSCARSTSRSGLLTLSPASEGRSDMMPTLGP